MDDRIAEIGARMLAHRAGFLVLTSLLDRAGLVDRAEVIDGLRWYEELSRQANHHSGAIAELKTLAEMIEKSEGLGSSRPRPPQRP